jgi:hypothetical protein
MEIGSTLSEARRRRHLEIADCERLTKIRGKYLRAMEEEDFGILPEPVFLKGFLRTYAEALGVDADLLLDEYSSRFEIEPETVHEPVGPGRPPPAPIRRGLPSPSRARPAAPRRSRRTRLVLLSACGLAAAGALAWVAAGGTGSGHHSPPATVRLTLTGVAGGTFVELRREGPRGAVVYRGRLAGGAERRFTSRRTLWLRVASAPRVRVEVGGRVVSPRSGGGVLLTPPGLAAT